MRRFSDSLIDLFKARRKVPMTNMESVFYSRLSKIIIPDEKIIFKLKPGNSFSLALLGRETILYRINSCGCRGGGFEFGDNKNSFEKRILFLGCSLTFGYRVEEEDTYANKLQDLLNSYYKGKYKIIIINAGVPGYSLTQGLHYLKETAKFYKPDWIIVWFGFTDRLYNNRSDKEEILTSFLGKRIRSILRINPCSRILMKVYFRLRYICLRILHGTYYDVYYDMYFNPKANNLFKKETKKLPIFFKGFKQRVSSEEFYSNIREIENVALDVNAKLIFIPAFDMDGDKLVYVEDYFYRKSYIDFLEEFNRAGVKNVIVDESIHLSPEGHSIIANLLFNKIIEVGL